jgi:hypothetical protein
MNILRLSSTLSYKRNLYAVLYIPSCPDSIYAAVELVLSRYANQLCYNLTSVHHIRLTIVKRVMSSSGILFLSPLPPPPPWGLTPWLFPDLLPISETAGTSSRTSSSRTLSSLLYS